VKVAAVHLRCDAWPLEKTKAANNTSMAAVQLICYPTWYTRTICPTGSIAPNCVAIAARTARWSPELAGDDARKPRAGGSG
jgi:hypothetical protein